MIQVSVLSAYGGRTIGRVVATIMSKIATDHVFKNYSLKGQRGKRKFKRLQIYKIVIRKFYICRNSQFFLTKSRGIP